MGSASADGAGADAAPDPFAEVTDAWLWSVRHPVAAELEGAVPGPRLAARLFGLEPADLDEATLIEGLAAWERVASWAAAGQARMIAELASRRRGARGAFLAEEVAVSLSTTRPVAEAKVVLALETRRVPALADALERGDVDVRRAMVLAEELGRLPEDDARGVAEAVLPGARACTAPQLRARLRRLELSRDPDGAAHRHERQRACRRVEVTPAPDAMAWLSAYLPADDAMAIHTTLTALAGDRAADDERSLDERRADALVDLATTWLDAGVRPDGEPLSTRQGRRPHLTVTASAAVLLGLDDGPADLHGYGPIPPEMARRIASRATWQPLLVDSWTGAPLARGTRRYAPSQSQRDAVVLRDRTCTFPGCRLSAERCDVDHVRPYEQGRAADPAEPPQTTAENLQALCRHHHRAKTHAGWGVGRREDGVTVWRSPTGQTYRRPPAYERLPAPPPAPPPEGVVVDLYPPPPF